MAKLNKNNYEVSPQKGLTSKKRARTLNDLLTVQECADFLGKVPQSILNYCQTGQLESFPFQYGSKTSYKISIHAALEMKVLLDERRKARIFRKNFKMKELGRGKKKTVTNQIDLIDAWDRMCEQGLLEGSPPHAVSTRKMNYFYLQKFLVQYGEVSIATLKACFSTIPIEQFAKRMKIWCATYCFYRWLVQEGFGYPQELELWQKYKPQRKLPPKRHTLTEPQIYALERSCDNTFDRVLVTLLSQTGLRSNELCSLKRKDIDLEGKQLHIIGKGGKSRRIGLNKRCLFVLSTYLMEHPKASNEPMFLNAKGNQLEPGGIQMRLDKLGRKTNIQVSAHSFRRAFVTINVNKGAPLPTLQVLCGHSSIIITRDYCQTSEDEAVEQAQNWDW